MSNQVMSEKPVVIVGAGLAGLVCALRLQESGIPHVLVEKSDRPGGRVRTEEVDGFRLDRGFQVFLTSYPEAQRWLDYDELRLGTFLPGARVWWRNGFHTFSDPLRVPAMALASLRSPVATFADKLNMLRLRWRLKRAGYAELLQAPDRPTLEGLQAMGFSQKVIDRFFRPFLGGIFLDPDLQTSQRMFEFVFGMFARGEAALPAEGMEAIPRQLASRLGPAVLRTGAEVVSVTGQEVTLADGERIDGSAVVLAGFPLSEWDTQQAAPATVDTTCIYFATEAPPYPEALLVVNGEGTGDVNNVAVLTNAAPTYSGDGRALVSVTVLRAGRRSDEQLVADVTRELMSWWPEAGDWTCLQTVRVPNALPRQLPGQLEPVERSVRVRQGLYRCGDHIDNASIQGAMVSGRRAAEAVIDDQLEEGKGVGRGER